jgi:hypothetical protein
VQIEIDDANRSGKVERAPAVEEVPGHDPRTDRLFQPGAGTIAGVGAPKAERHSRRCCGVGIGVELLLGEGARQA